MKFKVPNTPIVIWLQIISVCSVFWSCNKENAPDCFQKAGDVVTLKREIEAFEELELRDYIQYEFYDSTETFLEITSPKNLIPDIFTEVHNNKLKIENRNTCNFVRSYKNRIYVRVYAPAFHNIQNYSTGDIRCINVIDDAIFKMENRNAAGTIELNLAADTITVATHTGVSDVKVKGESTITNLFNQGLGIIDAKDLVTRDAFVNNSSINNVYVNSNGYFFALIEFSGDIFYTGTPNHIDQEIRGDGKLIRLE